MAVVSHSLEGVPLESLSLYHATDPILSSILVFYGPVITANSTVTSSRVQAHIISPSGVQSYSRVSVSPAAPIYAAVNLLPRDKQANESCRGLAVCLNKFLNEFPKVIRDALVLMATESDQSNAAPLQFELFGESHAADLANKMTLVDNPTDIIRNLRNAYRDRIVPFVDVDLVLPPGSITPPDINSRRDSDDDVLTTSRYGHFAGFMDGLSDPMFIPTSRLKHAPSQATKSNKSNNFSAPQKQALRLVMCELVDTEERYVGKMFELVNAIVSDFKEKAARRSQKSSSPDEKALMELFPQCLNEILDVNMGFLEMIRRILEETEQPALADLEVDTLITPTTFKRNEKGQKVDTMGAIALSRILLHWLPRFSLPYKEYMRAHQVFNQTLNKFMSDAQSSFSKRVHDTGEKKVRSLLMEPIQRLPRYGLLIDSMTSALPACHPAVKSLLRARDVISDICTLDSDQATDNKSANLKRLRKLVPDYPTSLIPSGRLISAADVHDLSPPYDYAPAEKKPQGILLIYSDYLVLVSKAEGSDLKARGLLTALDQQKGEKEEDLEPIESLSFSQALHVQNIRCSQSSNGRILYVTPAYLSAEKIFAFELATIYEGRASKLIEEIVKARIENRFPEKLRECGKWSLHSAKSADGNLGILVSVFEDEPSSAELKSAPFKVIFADENPFKLMDANETQIEALSTISPMPSAGDKFKMQSETIVGINSADSFSSREFGQILANRLHHQLRYLHQPGNPLLTSALLSANLVILSVITKPLVAPVKTTSKRPKSPTKIFKSWSSGQSGKEPSSQAKVGLDDVPQLPPPSQPEPPSSPPRPKTPTATPKSVVAPNTPNPTEDENLSASEETFKTYITAIRARAGNYVARITINRHQADSLEVDELYNILLEDPSRLQAASEASNDVLFVAFENFMSTWEEKIGPIMTSPELQEVQMNLDQLMPADFQIYFRRFLADMTPVHLTSLTEIIKLLADLLDAASNDSDRGALTAAFAEVLTHEGDPRFYVSLLDRLVEDYDNLFDEAAIAAIVAANVPIESTHQDSPATPHGREHRPSASFGSTPTSFRKRFGFGSTKDEARSEQEDSPRNEISHSKDHKDPTRRDSVVKEGRVGSLFRSFTKNKHDGTGGGSFKGSFTKSSLFRSRSHSDNENRSNTGKQASRDRLAAQNIFSQEDGTTIASKGTPLTSIGEESSQADGSLKKRNRRKMRRRQSGASHISESDRSASQPHAPVTPRREESGPRNTHRNFTTPLRPTKSIEEIQNTPASGTVTPSSNRPQSRPATAKDLAPVPRAETPSRQIGSLDKENVSPTRNTSPQRTRPATASFAENPLKRVDFESFPPRASPVKELNNETALMSPAIKPLRVRMQNPQKIRERLEEEKSATTAVEANVQAELASLENELKSTIKIRPKSFMGGSHSSSHQQQQQLALLSHTRTIGTKLSAMTVDFNSRVENLGKDFQNSYGISERRINHLDTLYQEAAAENASLYEHFNNELSKVTRDVKFGGGQIALRSQLKDALDELANSQKDNMKLKQEIAELKAQQSPDPATDQSNFDEVVIGS